MNRYIDALDKLSFTEEEQDMLTEILSDSMQATCKPVKRLHPRRVCCFAVLAAFALTVTAAAANSLSPILQEYFHDSTTAAKQTLEQSILSLDLEQSHNGYMIRLTECVGDAARLYIAGTLTLPNEPASGRMPGLDGWKLSLRESAFDRAVTGGSYNLDWDRYDFNTHTVPFTLWYNINQNLKGASATLRINGIYEEYWVNTGTPDSDIERKLVCEEPFVFSNFQLDYNTPSVSLQPNVQMALPFESTGQKVTLSSITITPLSIKTSFYGNMDSMVFPNGTGLIPCVFYDRDGNDLNMESNGGSCARDGWCQTYNQYYNQLIDLSQIYSIELNGVRFSLKD